VPLGNASLVKLASCQPELRRLVSEVSEGVDRGECPGVNDIAVLCGFRGEKEQNAAYAKKASRLQWPNSKHNKLPSLAVDMAPYPIDWSLAGLPAFRALRKYTLTVAERLGIKIRIISWDWPHYELSGSPTPAPTRQST